MTLAGLIAFHQDAAALYPEGSVRHAFHVDAVAHLEAMRGRRDALVIAQMAIEQGMGLDTKVAANGPTVGVVLAKALGP